MNNWQINEILTLSLVKGIAFKNIQYIIQNFQNLDDFANKEIPHSLKKIFDQNSIFSNTLSLAKSKAENQLKLCKQNNISIVSFWDNEYPILLKEISNPPAILYIRGALQKNDAMALSIVGTRKNSQYGKLCTERFAEYFVKQNIIVCSGLAYGIDTNAHLATLRAGGITYAVIASGIDCLSPQLAQKNADKIVESGGAIITEYPLGTQAINPYFIQRNRIISGISKATVIIESSEKGGSLWTAKFAVDQNRELFAVPGNINSEKSIGTNNLIKNDLARIAISPEAILKELGYISEENPNAPANKITFNSKDEEEIYNAISHEPIQIDAIADKIGMDISNLLIALLNLEFFGYVRQLPGKYYIRSH